MNFYYLSHFALNSTIFSQIENGGHDYGQTRQTAFDGSHPEAFFSTIMGIAPTISFDTPQLSTLLGLSYVGVSNSAYIQYRKGTHNGSRVAAATTSHVKYTATGGLFLMNSLTAAYQQTAKAQCRYLPVYDGTNFPLVYNGASAVSGLSNTPTIEQFTLGAITFDGTPIEGQTDLGVNFGHSITGLGFGDALYPLSYSIDAVNPVITLSSYNLTSEAIFGAVGPASPEEVIIWLRRKAQDGSHVPDATAAHAKITITYNHSYMTGASSGMLAPGKAGIMICPRANARDAAQMTIAVNQAIA